MEDELTNIRTGLERLQRSSGLSAVFGSQAHRFRVHAVLSESTVAAFEQTHGISLPAEYRHFLLEVGNGGAGPAYGLFKLGEMDAVGSQHKPWKEGDGFVGRLSQPFAHTEAWNDLSGKPEYDETQAAEDPDYEDAYHQLVQGWEERFYFHPAQMNGAIPICHLGCAQRQWLVVTGQERGNVWDDRRADEGGLAPLRQPDGGRISFLQWYRAWLEDALRHLQPPPVPDHPLQPTAGEPPSFWTRLFSRRR